MVPREEVYRHIIQLLNASGAEYHLFEHRAALTYEDLALVQAEAGFVGTEGKCLVMKAEDAFIVYVTLQGQKVDFAKVAETVGVKKVRLATAEELGQNFGAEPGCAYPFGFSDSVNIFVDPEIYNREWFLFSPLYPTKTVQVRGENLKQVFSILKNKVVETSNFNKV